MYRFDIVQQKDGTWKFELDGINLIVEGYIVDKDRHLIQNPEKAIAYFNVHGHVYGVSNQFRTYGTAEEFYDVMMKQYSIFDTGRIAGARDVEGQPLQAAS
jgi:hypothetical protein